MPITELPAELLVRIFRKLRDMHVQSYSNDWLPITHVCRDWRLVALDAAELWTQIYSVDPDCVQTFLMRSKSAPLDLCYPRQNSRCFRSNTVLPMLLSESSRFRRVELASPRAVQAFHAHPFPGGTPLLSHLRLRCSDHVAMDMQNNTVAELANGFSGICDHELPALRCLHLMFPPISSLTSIRGLFAPSLRALVIMSPFGQHPASTWGDILTGLPLLDTLTLTSVFSPLDSEEVSSAGRVPMPHVHLPRLSSLKLIEDDLQNQLSLLQHITSSDDIQITISNFSPRNPVPLERYMDTLRALSQKLTQERHRKATYPTLFDLRFTNSNITDANFFHNVDVALCTIPIEPDRFYCSSSVYDCGVALTLVLNTRHLDAPLHDFCPPLCDMLCTTFSWSALRKLCLSSCSAAFALCKDLFLLMTNLRVLSIEDNYLSDCLPLLGVIDTPGVDDAIDHALREPQVLFPVLEILTVQLNTQSTSFELLHDALLSRKATGYPVSRVHLCAYDIGSAPFIKLGGKAVAPLVALGCTVDTCVGRPGDVCGY